MGTSIGRGIASTATSAWTRQIASLVLYMTAARLLEPSQIGVFALAAAIVLLFEYAVFDSISEAVVQRVGLTRQHAGAALFLSVSCGALIALAGVLSADALERALAMPGLGHLVRVMSAAVGVMCLSAVHSGLLRRGAQFHVIALIAAGAGIVSASLGVGLLFAGAGPASLLWYFALEKVILCLATVWCARGRTFGRFDVSHVATLVPYAAAIGAQRMVFYARNQADRLVIGVIWGADILGIYQIAARIFDSLQAILLAPASKLFFVTFTKVQHHPALLRGTYLRALQAISLIAYPSFAGLSATSPETVQLLFGPQWAPSAILLSILALGGLPLVPSVMAGAALSATGRARAFLTVEIVSTVLGLAMLVVLSNFGLVWIAAAFILRETIAIALYVRILGPVLSLGVREFAAALLPCLGASAIMWATLLLIPFDALGWGGTATLLLKVGAGVLCYLAVMLIVGRGVIGQVRQIFSEAATVFPESEETADA